MTLPKELAHKVIWTSLRALTLTIVTSLLATPATCGPQSGPSTPAEWWYNFPSSPLKFKPMIADPSTMDLENLGSDTVIRFQLGCVTDSQGKAHVTERLPSQGRSIKAGNVYFKPSRQYQELIKTCKSANSLLGVVEVQFADGGTWTAMQSPSQ